MGELLVTPPIPEESGFSLALAEPAGTGETRAPTDAVPEHEGASSVTRLPRRANPALPSPGSMETRLVAAHRPFTLLLRLALTDPPDRLAYTAIVTLRPVPRTGESTVLRGDGSLGGADPVVSFGSRGCRRASTGSTR
nr:hypothetical protein GCM10020093_106180 [Planobispora longispora]